MDHSPISEPNQTVNAEKVSIFSISLLNSKSTTCSIKASAVVRLFNGEKIRIIFASSENKRRLLAILSTDIEMAEEEIVRLYGKRWYIEVFIKMRKQCLKLVEEIQIRALNGLIAHTSMGFAKYNILSWFQRQRTYGRFFSGMFRLCCKEIKDIYFIDALIESCNWLWRRYIVPGECWQRSWKSLCSR